MIPTSTNDESFAKFALSSIRKNTLIYHQPDSKSIPIRILPTRQRSLGQFSVLPSELLQFIIKQVDLESLASLRFSSHHIRSIIDETIEYVRIRRHGSNAIRAMKASRTLEYHTLLAVYNALTSKSCAFCGEFGPCLFVLTCDRCCMNCIARDPRLRIVPAGYALTYFLLSKDHITNMKTLEIIPGRYRCRAYAGTLNSSRPGEPLLLASDLDEKAIAVHGSREEMERKLSDQRRGEYDATSHFPQTIDPIFAHHPARNPNYDSDEEVFFPGILDGYRFAGAVEFPALHKGTDQIDTAFWCSACQYEFYVTGFVNLGDWRNWFRRWPKDVARAYDASGFLKHLESCEHAQKLSRCLEDGTEYFYATVHW